MSREAGLRDGKTREQLLPWRLQKGPPSEALPWSQPGGLVTLGCFPLPDCLSWQQREARQQAGLRSVMSWESGKPWLAGFHADSPWRRVS